MFKARGATLWDLLAYSSENWGDREAVVFPTMNISRTYQQMFEQAEMTAKGLIALGLARGEHVELWSPNRADLLAIEFGCAAAGTPLVMLNSEYRIAELEYALRQTDAAALLLDDGNGQSLDYIDTIAALCPELLDSPPGEWKSEKFPRLRYVIGLGEKLLPGMLMLRDIAALGAQLAEKDFLERKDQVRAEDTAFILFTSGTTGEPKAAMLSHANLLLSVAGAKDLAYNEMDRLCLPLPFFHAYAIYMVLCAVYAGAACVAYERYNANQILQAGDTGATVLCGTPTMFIGWLEALRQAGSDGAPLKKATFAGALCPAETVSQFLERSSIKEIWNLMGTTETMLVCGFRADRPLDMEAVPVGKPFASVEAKIMEADGKSECRQGEEGELWIRSPFNMKGYYGKPDATTKAMSPDGWYYTGDMAIADAEGNLSIVGRKKEIIIRGGENIFPIEVEGYLLTHPKVKEAQVVGIPSTYYGEEPVAFVSLHQGETATQLELKKYCREKIALFKVPVYIFFMESFPKTVSGKIQKFKLEEQALEIINKKKEGI